MRLVTSITESAVARAVIEHGQDLLRYLSGRKRHTADDNELSRETYLRLLRMHPLEFSRNPQAYLIRVAGNLLDEFDLRNERTPAPIASETHDERVRMILDELTPVTRAVLVLHRRDGMSYDQIAEQLSLTNSRVRQALSSALLHISCRLREAR